MVSLCHLFLLNLPQATEIRCRLGKYFVSTKNTKSAVEQFVEGLTFDGAHEESLELLAKCYLDTVFWPLRFMLPAYLISPAHEADTPHLQGKMKECQSQCEKLLAVNPDNKSASLMLADILFHTNNIDAATYHFKQLLIKKPDNFTVMSRMITLLWRAGNLDEAKMFLQVRMSLLDHMYKQTPGTGGNFCFS